MSTPLRTSLFGLLIIVVAACWGGEPRPRPTDSPASSAPSESPAESPNFGAIDHPTGATDVVLRFEEGGGFVMPAFLATQVPIFTLYGDGTIIFRNPALDQPAPVGSVYPMNPMQTARLSEDQVQELLTFALGQSGLGVARSDYPNSQIADAPTALFTVNAGGLAKKVSIYALGLEMDADPDGPARKAFRALADRLQNIDNDGSLGSAVYVPERYRGILMEGQPGVPDARPWPWTDIAPTDFVSNADPNTFQLPARVMTPEEVEVLGIDPHQGGFQGLALIGPDDGKVDSFALRPLLPDESE